MLPYLMYFLIPVISTIPRLPRVGRAVFVSAFACLAAISFGIHQRGADTWKVHRWNRDPVDVDTHPSRVGTGTTSSSLRGLIGPERDERDRMQKRLDR